MKAEKLKKVLLPVLALSLAIILTVTNVHAAENTDNDSANQEQVIAASENQVLDEEDVQNNKDIPTDENVSNAEDAVTQQEETISEANDTTEKDDGVIAKTNSDSLLEDLLLKGSQLELDSLDINDIEIYTYPIPVGTSSDSIVGYIKVEPDDDGTTALIELTGNMLERFDSSEIGIKNCILSIGIWKHSVNIEVSEDTDINDVGKIGSTDVKIGFDSSNQKNVVFVGDTTQEYGYINMLDKRGTSVCRVKFNIKEACPDFDTSAFGEKTFTMDCNGSPITFTVNFRRVAFKLVNSETNAPTAENATITIPIGGDLRTAIKNAKLYTYEYDTDSGVPYGIGYGFGYYDEAIEKIDNTKAGIQNIELTVKDDRGIIRTGTINVKVGIAEQSTIEEILPPQAQATIPSEPIIGAWDVPSGEAGAGTWTFQTDLAEGTEVVVWSFHNNKWLKIGIYKVNANGVVTVTFTADQLSPILITKNAANSGIEVNNSTVSSNDSDSNISPKTASPKTGDSASAMIFGITALLSLALISVIIYLKRKKIFA